MSNFDYDVVVVGGSLAGLSVAISYALHGGENILVLEKKKKPIHDCAGGIAKFALDEISKLLELKRVVSFIDNEIYSFGIITKRSCIFVENDYEEDPLGYVIGRVKFIEHLTRKAKRLGVEVKRGASFENAVRKRDGFRVTYRNHRTNFVTCKYLVGADGALSKTGALMGFEVPSGDDLHICAQKWLQFGVEDIKLPYEGYFVENPQDPDDMIIIYHDREETPKGYLWIFPQGGYEFRVGIGVPQGYGTPYEYLERWIRKYLESYTTLDKIGGVVPTAKPFKEVVKGNFALVGDAGRQCSALHGGGMYFGMVSGYHLGRALANDNLKNYQNWYRGNLYKILKLHYLAKRTIYCMNDRDMDHLMGIVVRVASKDLMALSSITFEEIQKIFRKVALRYILRKPWLLVKLLTL
ncbi:MAG: hypothetical protein DRJ34_05760 [Thermoprotei archaeon]|nr:MAG: hypothetical protein DRJ34_05760 [Thermoprotei archaeon]